MRKPRVALKKLQPGLPAAWYLDPGHYARELEAFWYSRWIAVCREEELGKPGTWRAFRLGSQSLFVVKNQEGGIKAFHNVCRHRGSVLCTAEQGSFERQRIVCPYHSWTYDLAGQLIATPRRMATPDFDQKKFPLYGIAVETWGGFVFVCLARKPPRFTPPGEFDSHRIQDLRIGKRIVVDVQANWKLVAENFSECFHCPPVHPELCRVVTAYREAGAWGLRDKERVPEYKAGAKTLTMDGTSRLPPFKHLNERQRNTLYIPAMLPPNLFLNVHPDYVNAHMMFPTGPESVRIVYDWLFEPKHMPQGADLEHYVALWDVTNRQDARNCEWQQQGIHSREFRHGYYVPQEFDCHRFAQWVRQGLRRKAAAPPTPEASAPRSRRAPRRRARPGA
jgi:Rieske 2Fe-2S family protein